MTYSPHATPHDVTIDANGTAARKMRARAMALIQGSAPELSAETYDLLRRRVRSASIVLFAGFLAFLIKSLFYTDLVNTTFDAVLFGAHITITVVCGMVALRLCSNCPHLVNHIRITEAVVFGGSAIFFLILSVWILTRSAAEGYIRPITQIWMLQIFMYALFIPNSLRRAILVIGSLAAAPVILMVALLFTSADFSKVIATERDFSGIIVETAMLLTMSAVAAVWGASMMGTLRREVFEAKQLGQYRLKDQIGEGGMGEVYLAEHLLLKRPCAIKLIRPDKAGDAKALARFEREVRATAKLTHWNTVEIYDYGRAEDGTFYYVMEYLPGLNLGQLVELHGSLPANRMIHLLMQTCEALSEAHSVGLIHRDIKPANIFAARRGGVYDVAKLLDFGLAKPLTHVTGTEITVDGTITGSPLYMAPEQATGDGSLDARSDIYSLGVVAYYLLTGRPPFTSLRPIQLMLAHANEEPVPPSRHNSDVPEDLEQIVMRCLEKDPDHRFQNVESLRRALAACTDAGTWTREEAVCWWENNGCPKKKALDETVLQAVGA